MRITLRQRREALGLTQVAAAKLCGIPQSTLSHYETASVARPKFAILRSIALAYGTTVQRVVASIEAQRALVPERQREVA
jgi:transcriptional regulator with XRE-family HTH domain